MDMDKLLCTDKIYRNRINTNQGGARKPCKGGTLCLCWVGEQATVAQEEERVAQ